MTDDLALIVEAALEAGRIMIERREEGLTVEYKTGNSPVTNAEVAGQSAWLASYELPRPYWQKPGGELFPCEVYWLKVQTNRVAEIKLIADSPEHLQTLKDCLSRFKMGKSNPSSATETTGITP